MSPQVTLILGGARSGKTMRALELAISSPSPIYIATAKASDDEMRTKIARHRAERGPQWKTIEAPLNLDDAVSSLHQDAGTCAVIDCLTLWLSNLMLEGRDVEHSIGSLIRAVEAAPVPLIFVSNEVGFGLAPESELGRAFRDAQGQLNQQIAKAADVVEFVVSGIPMRLKS